MANLTGAPPPRLARCVSCRQVIEPGDAFCRHCGKRQGPALDFLYHPAVILVLALTILGPFALPLVYLSKRMTPATKWTLTAVILVYTALVLGLTVYITLILFRQWQQLSGVLSRAGY